MDFVKIGDLVGDRFRIEKAVGSGSFAWVFVAHDLRSGQTVALKMLRPERFADEDALRRFESRELRLLERIEASGHSPHVVRLLEKRLLRHEGLPFLVLEYIDGPSLKEWLAERGKLDVKEVARIGASLAKGLSVIHAAGGVHRDLKPSNVRMRDGKTPVLVDLGIARALWETQKLTQHAAPLTPRYAAPEQREGSSATPAADVYALGVCLFEMLTNSLSVPSDPRNFRPETPKQLAEFVTSCLAQNPAERPSITNAVRLLDACTKGKGSRLWPWLVLFFGATSIVVGGLVRSTDPASPTALAQPTDSASQTGSVSPKVCTPLQGFVFSNHQEPKAKNDETLIEWYPIPEDSNAADPKVLVHIPHIPHLYPMAIMDGGSVGTFEILGFAGDKSCRRFSIHACMEGPWEGRILPACEMPAPPKDNSQIAIGDANGDGLDDIVMWHQESLTQSPPPNVANTPKNLAGFTVLRNADGTTSLIRDAFDLSELWESDFTATRRLGDIDRDGCADLVLSSNLGPGVSASSVYLFRGDCRGSFYRADDGVRLEQLAYRGDLGDVDEDGWLDLMTGPNKLGRSYLLRGNGVGFDNPEPLADNLSHTENRGRDNSAELSLEDWNGDGHLDLIIDEGAETARCFIHLGRGDGTFDSTPVIPRRRAARYQGLHFLPLRGR